MKRNQVVLVAIIATVLIAGAWAFFALNNETGSEDQQSVTDIAENVDTVVDDIPVLELNTNDEVKTTALFVYNEDANLHIVYDDGDTVNKYYSFKDNDELGSTPEMQRLASDAAYKIVESFENSSIVYESFEDGNYSYWLFQFEDQYCGVYSAYDVSLQCAFKTKVDQYVSEQAKYALVFSNAFEGESPDTLFWMDLESPTRSQNEKYNIYDGGAGSLYGGGGRVVMYENIATGEIKYSDAGSGQDVASCEDYNTAELREVFEGNGCYLQATGEQSTVRR